ncbi:OmpP1/FadL family transporter [Desulfospira joergensenii]|uniref:OmpP1/FadL family transporter n=1 Tax=Desulfospira joergensenii TaxID=53329 RepID=UPI0003B3BBC1|nr:outer membrane protein transport protein [Desulfospira joergensenii]
MRKNIVQILALALILGFLPQLALAGGVDNKQNWSAAYASGPSRNAAIDGADIAAYNPAGIVHLPDGLTCEIDAQFININYDHTIDGTDYSVDGWPIVPSLFTIYKKDKWGFYFTFNVPGGGGEVEYEQGNIITQKIANQFGGAAAFTNQYAYVESIDYGLTTGFSYAFTDKFSFSAGLRRVNTEKDVDLHGTTVVPALIAANGGSSQVVGKYEQEAEGYGGVFGLNYKFNNTINFGLRYETKVSLDWDTTIPGDTSPLGTTLLTANNREDGKSYARDLPAVLGLGMEWKATDKLTVKPSITYYFEESADWGDQNNKIGHDSYDLALSLAYQINETWSVSCGYMYTSNGMDPNEYGIIEQMSPPLDCNTFAVGGKYRYNERLAFTFGAMGSFYESETARAAGTAPETEYSKTNYTTAVSVEYRFF